MKRPARIHVFGASGSGTTTLGAAIARKLDIPHVDVDDYYWQPSDPPFQSKNEPSHRVAAIREAIGCKNEWVLSGSIVSWGSSIAENFTCAIFLELDPTERMNRLRQREQELYGNRIVPGGDMHADHRSFMNWAQAYDTATSGIRCRQVHIDWMADLHCPVVVLDSTRPVSDLLMELSRAVA